MKNKELFTSLNDEENKVEPMFKYLMNTNDKNVTEADIIYIKNLINTCYNLHKHSQRVKKSSLKIQGILFDVWGAMTIATLGHTLSHFPLYAYNMGLHACFSRMSIIKKYNETLKNFGLNFEEYQTLMKSHKLQELAVLADIYDSQYERGEKFTQNNEPFPDYANTDLDNLSEKVLYIEFIMNESGQIESNMKYISQDTAKNIISENEDNEPQA